MFALVFGLLVLFTNFLASTMVPHTFQQDPSSPEAIAEGEAYLQSRMKAWRAFGEEPRWWKVVNEGDDISSVWHSKPGFELATTKSGGAETIRICNERYVAYLTKQKDSPKYALRQIDKTYDVAKLNCRVFDGMSYTSDEYIPDLIESGKVKIVRFEPEGEKAKILLLHNDETRSKNLISIDSPGSIELTFGSSPIPSGLIYSVILPNGRQIHRAEVTDIELISGEMIGTKSKKSSSVYFRNGQERFLQDNAARTTQYFPEETLDSKLCYLEYYGLTEPNVEFAGDTNSINWLTIGILLAGVLVVVVFLRGLASKSR